MKRIIILLLVAFASLGPGAGRLAAQGVELHGADSTFQAEGLVLMWAVLRATDEASTMVVLDIVQATAEASRYRFYSVVAVDPFSGERRVELEAQPLRVKNRVLRARPEFQIFSNRRILFFADENSAAVGQPQLTVYYQGVPDTSPEFASYEDLDAYFVQVLQRLFR